MFVLDSHCDTPSQILRRRDMSRDNDHAHIDFPKLKKGGVDGAFFALYIPAAMSSEAGYDYTGRLLSGVRKCVESNPEQAAFACSKDEALANQAAGRFSVFLGLENGSPFGGSLERVKEFHDLGIRYVTLCHSADNLICDSCASAVGRWRGLSPFGKAVVKEMNRLGVLVDVSHISDLSFYDVIDCSEYPVVATHSCCRALADHPRNMTDEMIRVLAQAGGVIQINFYPVFLDKAFSQVLKTSGIMERGEMIEAAFIADPDDPAKRAAWNGVQDELMALSRPSYRRVVDHIDHVVSLVGVDHVGLGSDFDGIEVTPSGLEDASHFSILLDEMRSRGYSEDEISKIAGGNFFRLMR